MTKIILLLSFCAYGWTLKIVVCKNLSREARRIGEFFLKLKFKIAVSVAWKSFIKKSFVLDLILFLDVCMILDFR